MFDHIGLKVRNLNESAAFYAQALKPLGHVQGYSDDSCVGFGPPGAPELWLYASGEPIGPGTHVAFRVADRATVAAFHAAALAAGARDNGRPGPREHYSPTYYAAFVLDPDGHNIEAMLS